MMIRFEEVELEKVKSELMFFKVIIEGLCVEKSEYEGRLVLYKEKFE